MEVRVLPFKNIIVSDLASFLMLSLPRHAPLRQYKLAAHKSLNCICILFGSHNVF